MEIILAEDGGSERSRYQGAVGRALESAWRQAGHSVLRATPEFLGRLDHAGDPRDPAEAVDEILRRHPQAPVHLLTTGPIARRFARACAREQRPFTSTSEQATVQIHERRSFSESIEAIHATAARVVTPAEAASRLLQSSGVDNAMVVTAGVDERVYQPRVYSYLDLPRPISLLLAEQPDSSELREFLDTPLPGTRLVYAPDWTGGKTIEPVRLIGYLPPAELAQLISAADVCVIPGHGPDAILRGLQALACGVPVAARSNVYINELLSNSAAGAADDDIGRAVSGALGANRQICRSVALRYTWSSAAGRILAAATAAAYPDRDVA